MKQNTRPELKIEQLRKLLASFGLKTNNYEYFKIAFSHSTFANEYHVESNERIEYLGDSILNFASAEYIYHTFPKLPEGKMTKLRATYVCEDANFSYALELGLDELLLLGKGEETSGGRKKKAVVADSFECFLGAVYLTFDMNAVKKILSKVVFPHIERIDNEQFFDYKTRLQEYIQTDHENTLEYIVVKQEGKPNEKVFTMIVKLDDVILGEGVGTSKKEASQQAAKNALDKLVK